MNVTNIALLVYPDCSMLGVLLSNKGLVLSAMHAFPWQTHTYFVVEDTKNIEKVVWAVMGKISVAYTPCVSGVWCTLYQIDRDILLQIVRSR